MRSNRRLLTAATLLAGALALTSTTMAQTSPPQSNAAPTADNAVLLTIFFKHDQSRPLNELNAQLDKHVFYKAFPVLSRGLELVLHDPAHHGHRQLRRPLFNWAKRARPRPITGQCARPQPSRVLQELRGIAARPRATRGQT